MQDKLTQVEHNIISMLRELTCFLTDTFKFSREESKRLRCIMERCDINDKALDEYYNEQVAAAQKATQEKLAAKMIDNELIAKLNQQFKKSIKEVKEMYKGSDKNISVGMNSDTGEIYADVTVELPSNFVKKPLEQNQKESDKLRRSYRFQEFDLEATAHLCDELQSAIHEIKLLPEDLYSLSLNFDAWRIKWENDGSRKHPIFWLLLLISLRKQKEYSILNGQIVAAEMLQTMIDRTMNYLDRSINNEISNFLEPFRNDDPEKTKRK